jgi:HlyD family secretion protein
MNRDGTSPLKSDIEAVVSDGKTSRRWRGAIWVLVILGLAGVTAGVVRFMPSSGGNNAVRYTTEPAARGRLTVKVTATGSVEPTNKVDISSELSGTVRKVHVDFNSPVKAGDVLAELDTDKLRATLDAIRARLGSARARINEAEATLREKERDHARKRELAEKRIASTQDLDAAAAALDRAEASLATTKAEAVAMEADLRLAETNMAKAAIRSPITGVVLKRNVDPGQTVASSLQAPVLFSIAENLASMELQVDVDEADVGQVEVGQGATFTVDAYPDRRFPATIRYVRYASEVVQGVVTYMAVLTIDNREMLLRPGMTATAEITVKEVEDALLVPNAALRFTPVLGQAPQRTLLQRILPGPPGFRRATRPPETTGRQRTLWVLREGEPVAVPVAIGASDGRRTEIRSGELKAGDAVILDQTRNRAR